MYGIDFGTSNTVITYGNGPEQRLLSVDCDAVMPSLMFFERDRRLSIGNEAKADFSLALERYKGSKDLYNHFRFFQALKLALKDPAFKGSSIFGEHRSPESLTGLFLRELKRKADAASGSVCDIAVLGRPVTLATGNEQASQEKIILDRYRAACDFAGFRHVRFVSEPVAAAVGLAAKEGVSLVFDFGGGTLDIAITRTRGHSIDLLGSEGCDLGGYSLSEDISRARIIKHFGAEGKIRTMKGNYLDMPRWITDQVASFYSLPLSDIAATRRTVKELIPDARLADRPKLKALLDFLDRNRAFQLFDAIDEAKIALSDNTESHIDYAQEPYIRFHECIARDEFNNLVVPRVNAAKALVCKALHSASLRPEDIDYVIRVGGSSRVPAFAEMLEGLFPGKVQEGRQFTSIAWGLLAAHEKGFSIS